MACRSTRAAGGPDVTLGEAIVRGLAPDGGLYVPTSIPAMSPSDVAALAGRPIDEMAAALIAPLAEDTFDPPALRRLLAAALDFPAPLRPLDDGLYVLELFHGPTLAFKDFGARTMARLLAAVASGPGGPLTVLVATSGDTGGAVADAFFGVAGTRVVVLYPRGRVSPTQEAQFATLGGNVTAVAVEGTFDDCQRLVKEAFGDATLAARARLTSANSINIGRLLPQMAYYAAAVAQLPAGAAPPVVVVPSGNLGNLTAGVMARRRGVPIARFVSATTVNDPFPRFLASGRFEPRRAVPTLASAMDVGHPSNLERLTWLYGGDLDAMRRDIAGLAVTDDEVRAAMRELHARHGYVADPHTAVAYAGATRLAPGPGPVVLLATAHPAKFPEVVEPTLGLPVAVPPALAARLALDVRATPIAPSLDALAPVLSADA
ncbi:MAG: threonine synthase [Vicinamibacterales bacterium]